MPLWNFIYRSRNLLFIILLLYKLVESVNQKRITIHIFVLKLSPDICYELILDFSKHLPHVNVTKVGNVLGLYKIFTIAIFIMDIKRYFYYLATHLTYNVNFDSYIINILSTVVFLKDEHWHTERSTIHVRSYKTTRLSFVENVSTHCSVTIPFS